MQYYLTFLCLCGFTPTLLSSPQVLAVASFLLLHAYYQTSSSPSPTPAGNTGTTAKLISLAELFSIDWPFCAQSF